MNDTPLAGRVAVVSGEAVAEHSDAADPAGGEAIVAAAVDHWGRPDICVANAAICPGGMVHKQLHGDAGLSAYAASKGGLLAFGRSLAAEGAGRGVLTNMLLPYALTQLTDDGMPAAARPRMDPDLVAPVLTALASPECRLNGEYLVTGGGRLRRAYAEYVRRTGGFIPRPPR